MAYSFRTTLVASAPGLTITATVYGDSGAALGSQPALVARDLGNGVYGVILTLADGQTGWAVLSDGTNFWGVNISPPETENADAKTSAALTSLVRALGLLQENWVFRSPVYAGTNLVSAAVRLYDSAAHATLDDGATGLIGEYALTAVYDHGKLVKTTQVKV